MDFKFDFQLTSVSNPVTQQAHLPDPYAPINILNGKWEGRGFNQIWRPFFSPTQDRFLELNETKETLEFDKIPGDIPNRGLLQTDINLHGLRYLQQVQDAHVLGPNGQLAGIHVEPGIWLTVPQTTNPADSASVARMANIPHGTSLVAQGFAITVASGPKIDPVDITPFVIGNPGNLIKFPESNLSNPSVFRTPAGDIPGVTQAMVDNPNSVLTAAITGQNIVSTLVLKIATIPLTPPPASPTTGGGTSNISFLQGSGAPPVGGPNAMSAEMDAIFWVETVDLGGGKTKMQLQYSQRVLLNFNGLSWPHVSVATLTKVNG